jgi:thiol-disulfide isomerase/thioredoxin
MKNRFLIAGVIAGPLIAGLALASAWANYACMGKTLDDPFQAAANEAARVPPEFPKGSQWLQSKPLKLADLRGHVVVVHFWTFGCTNCIHNYPVYKAWHEKYAGNQVTLIGVHTPEFAREADVDTVRAKAKANGLNFPIVIDNDSVIWKNFGNRYWPSIYLVDKKGRVRYQWDGELDLNNPDGRRFAARIDELRQEKD